MHSLDLSSVGNHFFLGLQPTTTLHDKDRFLLDALKPAGIILFKSNFLHDADYDAWLETQRSLIQEVRECIGREKIFIATDHEGARVCRTPHPVTRFRSAIQWAAKSEDIARAMAVELRSLGINMNFAPVMDIHTNPANPVIGDRAFGTTPQQVAKAGVRFIEGSHSEQVWACAKHFPGHGDTDVDSHYDLPVLNLTEDEIAARELMPFKAAIEAGIEIIMTGHILFPKIDPDLPATLSRKITTGILRKKLGYKCVIVSDDIGMHAMDAYFAKPETARQFFEAGNDMLMVCAHFTDTERVVELASVVKASLKDKAFRETIHEPSHARVEALLSKTVMHDVTQLPLTTFEHNAAIDGVYQAQTVEVM
nr:putative beta-N-acetylglucosaminidase [uncultured bacterium]